MKLLVINHKGKFLSQEFLKKYTSSSIDYDFSSSLEGFLKENNSFDGYDGVLMHPPLGMRGEKFHETWLKKIHEISPNTRIAFATTNLGNTPQKIDPEINISLIDFQDIESIKKYFGERK
jgi:hypothetical protein